MIGLGLSLTTRAVLGLSALDPATLFAAGEQGILNDLSDLSTLFTDTAGTTPVTAPGQTVALALDKSGRGNHLTQSVAAARPIYGRHPASGIRNILAASEQFDNAVWAKEAAITITPNAAVAPDGTMTADLLNSPGSFQLIRQSFVATSTTHTVSAHVRAGSTSVSDWVLLNSALSVVSITSLSKISGPGTVVNISNRVRASGLTSEWTRFSATYSGLTVGATYWFTSYVGQAAGGASLGNVYHWGAQVEPGSTATAYQRVGAPSGLAFPQPQSYDITEAGVPSLHYLFCDGLARWMVSPTITPGIDKVQTWAGVRKLSDAARGTIASFSPDITANNGAFALTAPAGASATFSFESKGTTLTDAVGTFAAPTTRVVAGFGDIAGDRSTLRVNGAQVDQDTGDQGTGNYLAYQLFLGARGGTANYLNGLVYSFVARFGPNLPDATIQQVERWTAQRKGVTL